MKRVKESLPRSTVRSALTGIESGIGTGSSDTGATARFRGYGSQWFGNSTVAEVAATISRAASTVETWVVCSYLYRWLTKEPEPEVIVIDLRETYTVGPFLRAVDRVAPTVATAVRGSRARSIAEYASERVVVPISESRSVQLLAAALAPPEPPEAADREASERDGNGGASDDGETGEREDSEEESVGGETDEEP